MNTYFIEKKAHDLLIEAATTVSECVDCSTEEGLVLAGVMVKAALPWDASPNWELRHKPPTEALLIDGMPKAQAFAHFPVDVIHLVALMTGMQRGMPWACAGQGSVFGVIRSASEYAAAENIVVDELRVPRVSYANFFGFAPETVVLSTAASEEAVRVGWVSSETLTEHMPIELRKAAADPCFHGGGGSIRMPIMSGTNDAHQPAQLVLGTGDVSATEDASVLAIAALEYLRAVAAEKMTWIDLQPGQLLVIPNYFGQHAIDMGTGAAVRRVHWNRDLRQHRQHGSTKNPLFFRQSLHGAAHGSPERERPAAVGTSSFATPLH